MIQCIVSNNGIIKHKAIQDELSKGSHFLVFQASLWNHPECLKLVLSSSFINYKKFESSMMAVVKGKTFTIRWYLLLCMTKSYTQEQFFFHTLSTWLYNLYFFIFCFVVQKNQDIPFDIHLIYYSAWKNDIFSIYF